MNADDVPIVEPSRYRPILEGVLASVAVTLLVTLASMFVPEAYIATFVGFVFLGATWIFVWRKDNATVLRSGLALGGMVLPGALDVRAMVKAFARSLLWAMAFSVAVFPAFFFGWRAFWHPHLPFSVHISAKDFASTLFGQIVIIALPEEAFYRGYLQSRFDEVWPPRFRIAGAQIGFGALLSAVLFAAGHLATIRQPARLAVFFPALLFAWLRARTGGIGAAILFHAFCNVFSEMLGRGYGVY